MDDTSGEPPRHVAAPAARVRIQQDDFDAGRELAELRAGDAGIGAVVAFVGTVRDRQSPACPDDDGVQAIELEHYPGMTEDAIERMIDAAVRRFDLRAARVVHRVGRLELHAQIVLVMVAAAHRGAAFQGCEFLIDWLKTQAPFWKKEHTADGRAAWVDARVADDAALARWGIDAGNAAGPAAAPPSRP